MKNQILGSVLIAGFALANLSLFAGIAYPDPPGGWTYIYGGEKDAAGEIDFTSLDGTWGHDNGSDQWDGSKIGGDFFQDIYPFGNSPGGVMAVTEDGVTYLRMQDAGDPRDYGYSDPSNRKIFFGHNMTDEGAPDTILDDGVTLSFRARVPTPGKTSAPLDPLHRNGQSTPVPYPDTGDGYLMSDGGKGNFVIKQAAGGAIAFALTVPDDVFGGDPSGTTPDFAGLSMNEFSGNAISGNVDFGEGEFRGVPFDPTEWHEVWAVLRKDPSETGTHQAFIFLDGSKEPTVLSLTAGDGSDFEGSYLAMGGSRTDENWALDVDFAAYKFGIEFPEGALAKPFIGGFSGSPSGFTLSLTDGIASNATQVDPASVTATLDGSPVTPSVSKTDDATTVIYESSAIFPAGSTHTVTVTFQDTGTPPESITVELSYTVEDYATIPGSMNLDTANLDRNLRGFKVRPYGTDEDNPNSLDWTEEALAGQHGPNVAATFGGDAQGFFVVDSVINFDVAIGHGHFTDANGYFDDLFPGFPGFGARDNGNGNAIEEILTLIEFPSSGLHTMGVNSDDGFRVSVGAPDPRDFPNAITLGEFDGGRGSADTIFSFNVRAAGVYPFRLIWENGGGDANLEWFSVQPDGTKVLVNDAGTAGALTAYQFQLLDLNPIVTITPTIGVTRSAGQMTITFEGTLQSADSITGPWTDVGTAASPVSVNLGAGNKFYRTRQ